MRRLLLVLTLAAALVACRPIRYDAATGTADPVPQWRVAPVTVAGKPGIEIRMRDCSHVELWTSADPTLTAAATLRPTAVVRTASGELVFSTEPTFPLRPPGSTVLDTADDGEADVIRTPVPSGTLTIEAGCTSYPGYGMSSPNFTWGFPTCTTSTRTCAPVQGGEGSFR
ncbi:MAG: hypothetical protein R2702_12155 [Acidimicrobiales bacterium]